MHDPLADVKPRRAQYSEATKLALLDAAQRLFYDRGFAGTALADVAAAAQVTRGAVYHHFEDKRALYEAVFERLEQASMAKIATAATQGSDPWDASVRGLRAFLDVCCDPVHGRLVWQEGPLALGWQRWRKCEVEYGYGLTEQFVTVLMEAGYLRRTPLTTTTRLLFAMIGEAGLAISEVAGAGAKRSLRDEFEALLLMVVESLRLK